MPKIKFKKGQTILKEGDVGDEMYIIISGKAKVYKKIAGKNTALAVLGPDDFFGEMSLLLRLPRSATVKAATDTEILTCNKKDFLDMIRSEPEIAEQILTIMAKRLIEAHSVIIKLEGEKKSMQVMYGSRKR